MQAGEHVPKLCLRSLDSYTVADFIKLQFSVLSLHMIFHNFQCPEQLISYFPSHCSLHIKTISQEKNKRKQNNKLAKGHSSTLRPETGMASHSHQSQYTVGDFHYFIYCQFYWTQTCPAGIGTNGTHRSMRGALPHPPPHRPDQTSTPGTPCPTLCD